MTPALSELRVVLVPMPVDPEIDGAALAEAGFDGVVCPDLASLCEEIAAGAGVVILTEEIVEGEGMSQLIDLLAAQPPWSDLPIVVLGRSKGASPIPEALFEALGNVTLLERPATPVSVVSALKSALRARDRQLQCREHLRSREESVAALGAEREKLDLVMRAADAGTWYCDLPPTEMVGNRAYRRHLGLDPNDANAIDIELFFSLLHPDDRAPAQAAFAAALAHGTLMDLDYRTCGPDGVERWVRAAGRTLVNREGVPVGFHGTTMDLTARRAAVSALARSEARSRAIGETLPFGAWECDPTGRVVHLAQAFLALLGRDLNACRDQGWSDRVHPDDRERFVREWPGLFAQPVMFDREYRVLDETGQSRTVLMRGVPLFDEARAVTAWVGINLDITEKRMVEQELERVDRLESVRVVAGGIAHDFNDLLTGLLGNIVLARLGCARDEEVVRRLNDAEHAGKQAQQLTSQLLTFARGAEPVRTPIWVPGLVREAAEFALLGLGVRCDYTFAEDLPGVDADAAQLGQVVQNLVLHGANAMGREGVLSIRAASIRIGATGGLPLTPGPYVMVSVSDRGRPIPPSELAHIFDILHSTKAGTGIGLPIACTIVRRHGGHILAASGPEGSVLTFYLPAGASISPPSPRASLPPLSRPAPRGRIRLLVMDDDPQVRSVAYLSLARLGYQVGLAANGASAVETYRSAMRDGQPFRVVFLDLTVPGGMGGRETLQQLRELDADVRAIAVTGYTDDPLLVTFAEHGFLAAITKPYTLDDLDRVLHAASTASPSG